MAGISNKAQQGDEPAYTNLQSMIRLPA
jgi:hypothetical protein